VVAGVAIVVLLSLFLALAISLSAVSPVG
jgi:hypothetical protein